MDADRVARRLALLRQALALDDGEREELLNRHPELFAEQYFADLRAAAAGAPDEDQIQSFLAELSSRVRQWNEREASFVIGYGPYEVLFSRVGNGLVDPAGAEQLAAASPDAAESESYVQALTTLSRRLRPEGALLLLGIVRAAVQARPGGVWADETGPELELQFVRAAGQRLVDEADGRLARQAQAAGEAVLAQARQRASDDLVTEALLALGALATNPWTARRTSQNFDAEIYQWQRRFWENHRAELAGLDAEAWQMPDARQALRRGAGYYREAADLMTGHDRGLALKAAFQSLAIVGTLGETVDHEELVRIGHEAASLIDPRLAPGQVIPLLGNLHALGEEVDPAILDELLAPSWDSLLRDHGEDEALSVAIGAVPMLRRFAPRRAEEVATSARPLVHLIGYEWAKSRQWGNELEAFVSANVPDGYAGLPDGPLDEAGAALAERAQAEGWDPAHHAAVLVGLAGRSPHTNEEAAGLALLAQAEAVAPVWSLDHQQALRFQCAYLYLGLAVNAVNAEDWAAAIDAYATALNGMCGLGLRDAALDVLARIDDLVLRSGHDGAVNAVVGVAPFALTMEQLAGAAATAYVQQICRDAVAALADAGPNEGINPEALLAVLQAAKGLRFAGLLLSRSRFRWSEDEAGRALLERLDEAARDLPGRGEPGEADPDRPIDEQLLLAAYAATGSTTPDDAPDAEVRALRRAYDAHFTGRLLRDSRADDIVFLGSEDLRRGLDERTVLIDIYVGASAAGQVAIHTVAVSQSGVQAAATVMDFPVAEIRFGDKRPAVHGSIIGIAVSELRRGLLKPSEPDPVSDETRESLQLWTDGYLHGVGEWLAGWRDEGYDHLCFIPHGPLHVLPFHLFQHDGRPLAEDWTVTVLPNHALLLDERGGATTTTRRQRSLTAFGLTYPPGNPHGRPPLRHAADEARLVASVFDATPVLDEEATEGRFLDALASSRYVHLAAHGRYDVEAPAFHCVYLAPGDGSDGRLRAYEVTSLDLRGTEMVTLSACETSLGGVDIADNISGQPAALFLAGVRCVVGTLWEVRSDTAAFFFHKLYQEVRAGGPRHHAFARAQRQTRARYPVYRDWGAFCYLGGWD